MAEHRATIEWTLDGPDFRKLQYSRAHTWTFDGGTVVPASASPAIVPLPWSTAAAVDPEEAYVAALSSCHMLWWLSLAARAGYQVVHYRDEAVGHLQRDERGRYWMARVILRPAIRYGAAAASAAEETELHEQAHAQCFLAHSVRTEIVIAGPADARGG